MNNYNDNYNNEFNNKAKQIIGKRIKKTIFKVIKWLLKIMLPYFIPIIIIGFLFIAAYLIIFEFVGTEKQYIFNYPNETIITESGVKVTTEEMLNRENAIIRDFYKYFSGQSYYKIIGNDNTKLIKPNDENDNIFDYYKREDEFKLSSNLLFAFDELIYESKWRYPEQIIKPVYYEPSTLTLKQLTDEDGFVVAESNEEDIKTGIKTGKKIMSVRDYGLGTIIKYNLNENYKRTLTIEGVYDKIDYWDDITETVKQKTYYEPFEYTMDDYPQSINLIDKVISFAGEIEYKYQYKKMFLNELTPGETNKENEPKTKYLFDTYSHVKCKDKLDVNGNLILDKNGEPIQVCTTETYELYKYRNSDSAIYETLPVVSNSLSDINMSDFDTNKYFKDYVQNFESYIPVDTINDFDFNKRIDYSSSIFDFESSLTDDYGFNLGSKRNTKNFTAALQYLPLIEKYAYNFNIDPYIIVAIIAQESGGNSNINKDGLLQITGNKDMEIATKNKDGIIETFMLKSYEKQSPEQAIHYAIMHLSALRDKMGCIYKAIQAYNFGEGTMDKVKASNIEAWQSNFGWLLYREEGRLKQFPNTQSKSYGCMSFKEGIKTTGIYAGDSCYLENVLSYYVGNEIQKINNDKNSFWDKIKSLGNEFFIFIKNRQDGEIIEKANFKSYANYDMESNILKMTKALDETILFSEADYGDNINFWDNGYLISIISTGMSLLEILDIAPNEDGYLPPVDMNIAAITSFFGYRIHPIKRIRSFHAGVDIAASEGTHVYSIAPGKVIKANYFGTAGNQIVIEHDNNVTSAYLHLSAFAVKEGDWVYAGQHIGNIGNTGLSSGAHLHFEFRVFKNTIDPTAIVLNN